MEDKWAIKLTEEQYRICRQCGTEPPFKNKYWNCKESGIYHCICCDIPLFSSDAKFESGSGWPSFTSPISEDSISSIIDKSFGMTRIEVKCKNCDSHLGHVFDDGPKPNGLRYCINSASLSLTLDE
ncbi:MAG: peptide-methionine (R)-S-oxide reductase [Euryarchaeota archaeon]|nr:peptide-methionine (R)-S-oxide reductase [Euryarchaeota archaeon]|tara:strand:+ start:2078 stop:2455 length:378 start_codon:yes stop_codon:yes gene_type:complete